MDNKRLDNLLEDISPALDILLSAFGLLTIGLIAFIKLTGAWF